MSNLTSFGRSVKLTRVTQTHKHAQTDMGDHNTWKREGVLFCGSNTNNSKFVCVDNNYCFLTKFDYYLHQFVKKINKLATNLLTELYWHQASSTTPVHVHIIQVATVPFSIYRQFRHGQQFLTTHIYKCNGIDRRRAHKNEERPSESTSESEMN